MDYKLCQCIEDYRQSRRNLITAMLYDLPALYASWQLRLKADTMRSVWPDGRDEIDMYESGGLALNGCWAEWEG